MKLHIEGLTRNIHSEHIREIFSTYGEVVSAQVETDKHTGISKGFGFVEFCDRETAETAQVCLDGAQIDGQSIKANLVLINRRNRRSYSPSPQRRRNDHSPEARRRRSSRSRSPPYRSYRGGGGYDSRRPRRTPSPVRNRVVDRRRSRSPMRRRSRSPIRRRSRSPIRSGGGRQRYSQTRSRSRDSRRSRDRGSSPYRSRKRRYSSSRSRSYSSRSSSSVSSSSSKSSVSDK